MNEKEKIIPELIKMDLNFNLENHIFDSENKKLNDFLFKDSKFFLKENLCQIYIYREENTPNIIGYITLCCSRIELKKGILPAEIKIGYSPGLLIGMLAVDKKYKRKYFGIDLLKLGTQKALKISMEAGCRVLIVDALTIPQSISLYKKFEFDFLHDSIGKEIEASLRNGQKCERENVKMFFDLSKIKKPINP